MIMHLRVCLFFLVILLVLFYPVLFGNRVLLPLDQLNTMILPYSAAYTETDVFNHFVGDALFYFYNAKVVTRENLLHGTLAYWNSSIFGGYPQYAATHGAHFDVTNIILLVAGFPLSYHLQVIIQLLLAGIGMYLLLRSYQLTVSTSVLFGMAYMLNSMFIVTLLHRWIVGSFCWVPLVIVAAHKYLLRGQILHLFLGSLFLAFSFMGGSIQTSFYVAVAVCAFMLSDPAVTRGGYVQRVWAMFAVLGLGLALSAVMLVPTLEMVWLDVLAGGSRALGGKVYSLLDRLLSIPLLLSFFMPGMVGNPRTFDLTKIAHATMGDFTGYSGFVPIVLGIWGVIHLWKREATARPFTVIAALGLLVPLFTPLYRFVYHRFFILFIFGIVVVGAIAFDRVLKDPRSLAAFQRFCRRVLWFFLGLLFLGILANIVIKMKYDYFYALAQDYVEKHMYVGQSAAGNETWMLSRIAKTFQHFSIFSPSMYVPFALIFGSCGVLLSYSRKFRSKGVLVAVLTCITFVQLLLFARSWLPMIDQQKYPLFPPTKETQLLSADTSQFRVLPLFDLESSKRVFPPNILSLYHVSTITGYDGITARTVSRILDASFRPHSIDTRLLGILNVKYVLTNKGRKIENRELVKIDSTAIDIYQNLQWKPRAFFRNKYEMVRDEEAILQRMQDSSYDGSVVLLSEQPSVSIDTSVEATALVSFEKIGNNELRLRVKTDHAGFLVISDTYYPGWKVWVNSLEGRVYRANYAMRAVCVPAGKSVVDFSFDPVSFKIGLWTSLACLLVCPLGIGQYVKRSKQQPL
jgi:hypothetical protein